MFAPLEKILQKLIQGPPSPLICISLPINPVVFLSQRRSGSWGESCGSAGTPTGRPAWQPYAWRRPFLSCVSRKTAKLDSLTSRWKDTGRGFRWCLRPCVNVLASFCRVVFQFYLNDDSRQCLSVPKAASKVNSKVKLGQVSTFPIFMLSFVLFLKVTHSFFF